MNRDGNFQLKYGLLEQIACSFISWLSSFEMFQFLPRLPMNT